MANGQGGKGSSKSISRDSRKQHSGRKWYFAKERNGEVRTLYAHNKSPMQAQDGTDPGSVVQIKSTDYSGKIKVKYSSDKSLLLDLSFFNAADELNKQLFLEIADVSKFGQLASELLAVEFCESRAGKRKSAVACENDIDKTKRPRTETNSCATGSLNTPGSSHVHAVSSNVGASTSSTSTTMINSSPPAAASTSQSTSSADEDDVLLDSTHQYYAISLRPRKVLVSSLKAPRKAYMLRDIDDVFVKSLIREFKENEVLLGLKPLLVIVKGLQTPRDFREEMLDSYELEVIGGNHRRAAMQAIQVEKPSSSQYEYTEAVLFSEMPKAEVLRLAYKHNRMDQFHHEMTTQEKVKLCHSLLQDEFGGQKNAEWKSYCSAVINSKESLEFIFLLSGLEKEVFSILEKVFKTFEEFKIKDQTSSVSQAKKLMCGAMQQPNLVASKFKCIRGLDTDSLKALLAKVADGEMSFAEMKLRAMEIKNIAALKTEFVKKAGCESWEEALERFPDFTSEELLQQFIGSVHKRKADREFMALIERALQAEVSVQDNGQSGHSTLCKINGTWYCALRSEGHKVTSELLRNIPFTGADLTVIQDQPTWCEEKVKSVIRQICGLNTRSKLSNYIIVIRKKSDPSLFEGCTPAGKGHIMYVAWSGMSAKAGTGLTNTVEKVAVLFVGTTSRSATNWFVAKKEQDLMRHLIEVFIPPRGMLLELGSSQAQVSSSLIPAFDCKVNLLSIYDKQDPVSAFNMEITKLSNARSSASGTDAE